MRKVLGNFQYDDHVDNLQIPLDQADTIQTNQFVGIRNYTSRRYLDINQGMRVLCTDVKHLRAVKILMEALDSLPIHSDPFVVRWINLTPELREVYKVGNVIHEQGFTSTSADKTFVFQGKEYKVVIQHLNGRYVADWSEYPGEQEVLIPSNSYFKVMVFDEVQKLIVLSQIDSSELQSMSKDHSEGKL